MEKDSLAINPDAVLKKNEKYPVERFLVTAAVAAGKSETAARTLRHICVSM